MRRETLVDRYMNEIIDYGGELMTRANVIRDMQEMGVRPSGIDRWFQGYELMQRIRARQESEATEE